MAETELEPIKMNGPAVAALTPKMRAYVFALLESDTGSKSDAVRVAGYDVTSNQSAAAIGCNLSQNPKVLAAIRELAENQIKSASLVGMKGIMEIAVDFLHKDRLKACVQLLDRANILMPQHKQTIVVKDDRTNKQLIDWIRDKAEEMGLDPKVLLGQAGVVDAEYEELGEFDAR